MAHLKMETPVTSRHDVELERRRNLIAARRRILEREVLKYLIGDNNNHTFKELEHGDEYEEVLFDPSKAANEIATALVSRSKSAERKRRSNSDSDLYIMDENREVELCSTSKTVLKITVEDDAAEGEMPEQGFYRVYDDLEKIREFDLIPYVLERKKRQRELKEDFGKQGVDDEAQTDKTSPDSGRASVVSSDLSETAGSSNDQDKRKSTKSDAGSSCSVDSGTYNLYPEAAVAPPQAGLRKRSKSNDFLKRLSLQLSSVALRPSPPPMPPKGKVTPPPLPPRTFSRCPRSSRRKDLSTHLGLVSEGSSSQSDRVAAHEVAMRNFPPQLTGSGISLLGKKDLKRHLGVHEITDAMPPAQNSILKMLSPPKPSQLLVQLHLHQRRAMASPAEPNIRTKTPPRSSSPPSSGTYSAEKSCRRELNFGAEPTRLTEATILRSRGLGAPPPPTTTPGSVFKALASASTSGRISGRSVASKIFFKRQYQTPKRHSSRSPSPSKHKNDGLTPVSGRKLKVKESRRSFMSSLLSSPKTKPVFASADPIMAPLKNEAAAVRCRTRDYSRTVEEALKEGLPVIPFGSSSMDELTTDRESNVYLPMGASSSGRSGTWSAGSSAGLASAMATPTRGTRQHCLSCTCKGNASEWDYVRMQTPMMRPKRRKSLGEIITGSFIA